MAAATTPIPSSTPTIVGSWTSKFDEVLSGKVANTHLSITFLNNGTYLIASRETGPGAEGAGGLQLASYSWNASTGVLTSSSIVSTGGVGLPATGTNTLKFQAGGKLLLNVGVDNQNILLEPVLSSGSSIVGSWYSDAKDGGSDDIVITFLADGTLFVADKGTIARDPSGTSGIEYGTYTWNAATGAVTYNITYNADGQWGLSHGGPKKLLVSGSSLKTFDIDGVAGSTGPSFIRVSNEQAAQSGNLTGTAGADTLVGTTGDDVLTGGGGNDTIDGGAGIDTAVFAGTRAGFTITKGTGGYTVTATSGSEGTDTLTNVERVKFTDKTVNLTLGDTARSVTNGQLDSLIELYIAYVNRVPDADGMAFWIGQLKAGQSLSQIGEAFYGAALQFSSLTGYSANMTNGDFVTLVYKNVLGRSTPDAEGLAFWSGALANGSANRGTLVSSMLSSAHTFKGNAQFGYVADLLDNKISVGKQFAITNGLLYNTSEDSISQGMAIAAAVTPTSTTAAISLIGVTDGLAL